MTPFIILVLLLQGSEPARRKSRRKQTKTSDAENAKMLADILRFINDEPPSVKDPIEGCPSSARANCPVGYTCNVVRSRTCRDGECILNKTQVCELDCQLTMCNQEDFDIQQKRQAVVTAGGKDTISAPQSTRDPFQIADSPPKQLSYPTIATTTTSTSKVTEPTRPAATMTSVTNTQQSTSTTMHSTTSATTSSTTPVRTDDEELTDSDRVARPDVVVTGQAVSRLNENCIYLRRERLFECQNWHVSTIVSDLRRARDLSFKLPYTIKQAMPNLELPLHKEWLPLANQIVPAFSQEVVTSHVFTYCINAEFHNFYASRYKSKTKTQLAAIKSIVKMSATCKIPLTPMRKKLMLAAQRHFFHKITKPRFTGFAHFCIERTEETPTVDPSLEIKILGPILAKLVSRAVNRVWAKSDIYLKIVGDADYYGYKLPPALDEAVERTLEEASQEPNLAHVTSLLVKNIHSEDLRRKTRYSYTTSYFHQPGLLPNSFEIGP